MSHTYEVSRIYKAHVAQLQAMSDAGDDVATRSLAAFQLLIAGWRYGHPDPVDNGPDDDNGLTVTDILNNVTPLRKAA